MNKRTLRSKKSKPRSARPYDRQNESIFGKVCSTVKGLLNPSWLINNVSQWMGNPEQEEAADVEEETIREDNDIVSQSVSHENKRLRLRLEDRNASSIQSSSTQTWPDQTLYHQSVSTPQSSLLEAKESLNVMNGDDHSENSEGSASTSGCSSLVSSNNRLMESPFQNRRSDMKNNSLSRRESDTSKTRFSDVDNNRSLWSSNYSPSARFQRRLPIISNTNQPNFNLSSFVGPSKLNNSMESKVTSPFYEGRTTFGGASALKRMTPSLAPYQVDRTLRNQIKVREQPPEDSLEGMSSAAKRILLTLEKMSSPVADAKKMPNTNAAPVDLSLYLTPPKSRRNSQFTPLISKGPPIANINTIAKLATLKNYGVNRLRNTLSSSPVSAAEQKASTLDILQPCPPETIISNVQKSGGGKIRNKLNQQHLSAKDTEYEMPDMSSLPNVPLPISSLPTISFGQKSEKPRNSLPAAKDFTFSNPIEHDLAASTAVPASESFSSLPCDSKFDKTPGLQLKPFVFSSPIEHELPNNTRLPLEVTPLPVSSIAISNVVSPSEWECSCCWVRNPSYKTACLACETPKKGSSGMKNFENKPKVSSAVSKSTLSPDSVFSTPKNTQTVLAKSVSLSSVPSSNLPTLSTPATWECSTCWVRNPVKESKCVCCETARPTSQSSAGLSDTVSKSTWECSSCWVSNPVKEKKCLACETLHPDKDATPALKGGNGFKFSSPIQNSPITFKFGNCVRTIQSTSTTSTFNLGTATSTTAETTATTASGFKFVAADTAPETTVKFGSASVTTTTPSGFQFGIPSSTTSSTSTATSLVTSKASETLPSASLARGDAGFKVPPLEISSSDLKQPSSTLTDTSDANRPCDSTLQTMPTTATFKFNPAGTSSETATTTSGFKFGTTSMVPETTTAASGFKLGAADTTTTPAFKVGISLSETNTTGSNFKFGVVSTVPETTTTMSNKFGVASTTLVTTTTPSFKFGAANTTSESTAMIPSFKFGAPATTSASTFFSTPSSTVTSKTSEAAPDTTLSISSGFKIPNAEVASTAVLQPESNSNTLTAISSSFLTSSNFKFGAATAASETTSTTSVFKFNAASTASETASTTSVFKFSPATSAPLTTTSGSGFKFGAPTSTFFSTASKSTNNAAPTITSQATGAPATSLSGSSMGFKMGLTDVKQNEQNSSERKNDLLNRVQGFASSQPDGFLFKGAEKPPDSQTPSGGFVFGAPKTEAQSATATPFIFGSSASASNASAFSAFQPSQATNPTFQFGGQPSGNTAPAFGASTNFVFTKSDANPITSLQNAAPAFGSSTRNFALAPKTEVQISSTTPQAPAMAFAPATSTFSFGSKVENTVPQNPAAAAFGSSVFGNAPAPPFGAADKPASGGFTFGAPNSGVFQFGGASSEKKLAAPSTGFTFGTPAAPESNSFSSNFTINTPPSFNFGATSTPTSATPFQFAASAPETAGGQVVTRKYRKALRRVRKD